MILISSIHLLSADRAPTDHLHRSGQQITHPLLLGFHFPDKGPFPSPPPPFPFSPPFEFKLFSLFLFFSFRFRWPFAFADVVRWRGHRGPSPFRSQNVAKELIDSSGPTCHPRRRGRKMTQSQNTRGKRRREGGKN